MRNAFERLQAAPHCQENGKRKYRCQDQQRPDAAQCHARGHRTARAHRLRHLHLVVPHALVIHAPVAIAKTHRGKTIGTARRHVGGAVRQIEAVAGPVPNLHHDVFFDGVLTRKHIDRRERAARQRPGDLAHVQIGHVVGGVARREVDPATARHQAAAQCDQEPQQQTRADRGQDGAASGAFAPAGARGVK